MEQKVNQRTILYRSVWELLVKSIRHFSYEERLRALGLPSLEYRRERADMIQFYKIMHDIDKIDKDKFSTMHTYGATRGHSLFKVNCSKDGHAYWSGQIVFHIE